MTKTLILSWYNLAHNVPIQKLMSTIIKQQSVNDQLEFLTLTDKTTQTLEWVDVDYTKYNRIILYPRETTYLTFDFFRLFQICEDNNIKLINSECYDALDKYSLNVIWKNEGVAVPKMIELQHKLDRLNIKPDMFPAIISMSIGHGTYGDHTLIFDTDSIEMWLRQTRRSHHVIVTKYINYRDSDGWFRKGRIIRLDDNYIDVNIIGNRTNWHVHHKTKGSKLLATNCSYYREKIPTFDEDISLMFENTNIQVGAMDFCEVDGKIVPFEITVPYNISYRQFEYENENYNEFREQSIENIINYWTIYLRDLCDIDLCNTNYDWIKFKHDIIDYININKGFTID